MHQSFFALMLLAFVGTAGAQHLGFPYGAQWGIDEDDAAMRIQLRVDKRCTVYVADYRKAIERRAECTYWVHGGRIRLRVRGERAGEGFSALEIEHLRDSDTLHILGDNPKVLTRIRLPLASPGSPQ